MRFEMNYVLRGSLTINVITDIAIALILLQNPSGFKILTPEEKNIALTAGQGQKRKLRIS